MATIVSTTKLTYQDIDGDNVTVTFSKPILTDGIAANTIFTFDTGTVNGSNSTKQQLRSINLAGIPLSAGTKITTSAVRSASTGGDGFAALGQIDATGRDLGAVTIDGDLGRIIAGDATTSSADLGDLKVHSLGRFGTLTGALDLISNIQGAATSLTTKTDVQEAVFKVQGKLGKVTIGGSLIGGTASGSGSILTNGDLGDVKITGNVIGGAGSISGRVQSGSKLANIAIGGSLIGGSGNNSGFIISGLTMGAVTITGNMVGGTGMESGFILSPNTLASLTIGGSLIGGSGVSSGFVNSSAAMGAVTVSGNIMGGSASQAGLILSESTLASLTIGGSLIGGGGASSGAVISTLAMGAVKVTGDVIGGSGDLTARIISFDKLASVTIGGSLIGGNGQDSGKLFSTSDLGPVKITGDVRGSSGQSSGQVRTGGKLASLTLGGSLIGGNAASSGQVFSSSGVGAVSITGDIRGGTFNSSNSIDGTGIVNSFGPIASLTVGGSIIGAATFSGCVFTDTNQDIGAVKITGDVRGSSLQHTGQLNSGGKIASVTIGGSLFGGSGQASGQVFSNLDMGAVSITGNVVGGSFNASSIQDATGAIVTNRNLASVTIGGSLIGGFGNRSGLIESDLDIGGVNGTGGIGPVSIKGDVVGGTGTLAGSINARSNKLAKLSLGGSLRGGAGVSSGSVLGFHGMGALDIKRDVIGSSGDGSGVITTNGKLESVTIGGSLKGGSASGSSGLIFSGLELTKLTINGDIIGGSISGIETILGSSGAVQADRIGTLTLGGSLIAGTNNSALSLIESGSISVVNDIASATIKGSLIGNSTNRAVITARGQAAPSGTTDLAIGKLTINGRVEMSLIHAGIRPDNVLAGRNADAQIGPVVVGHDWIASDLVAGALSGVDGKFGTGDDLKITGNSAKDVATVFSSITSIVIGGQVFGTPGGSDHFGFVAQSIGSLKVKGGTTTYTLLAGNGNDDFLLSLLTSDIRLNEIA